MDDNIKKDLQQLLDKLWSESDLKVNMKNSVKGGIKTAGCAVVGGLVGGPPGIAVGEYINYPFVKQTLKQLMNKWNERIEDTVTSSVQNLDKINSINQKSITFFLNWVIGLIDCHVFKKSIRMWSWEKMIPHTEP